MTTTHSQVIDAIDVRISTRDFNPDPIEDALLRQLKQNIDAMSLLSDARFTFLENHSELFDRSVQERGEFNGAAHLIVLSGPRDDTETIEKTGFYGQRLALTAVLEGLATCWVDQSIDLEAASKLAQVRADKGEIAYAAIAVGYFTDQETVLKKSYEERAAFQQSHRSGETIAAIGAVDKSSPAWYRNAITAVAKAPFPANKQPIRFKLHDDERHVSVSLDEPLSLGTVRDHLVLGIDKLHFQIGAAADPDNASAGEWSWGFNGVFTVR
ncbi:nitroreductase family protein [Alloscardovia venturai]|uniref:Nitroreductase family protein n=1 Tax=Alloscardovia venturai TaxID=1769421 RepID=A0ABW2Y7C5_9BIFI